MQPHLHLPIWLARLCRKGFCKILCKYTFLCSTPGSKRNKLLSNGASQTRSDWIKTLNLGHIPDLNTSSLHLASPHMCFKDSIFMYAHQSIPKNRSHPFFFIKIGCLPTKIPGGGARRPAQVDVFFLGIPWVDLLPRIGWNPQA